MSDEADAAIRSALAGDDGLAVLVDMMAVSRRFHFFILASDTPRVTHAALAYVHARVEADRGEEVALEVLDPHDAPGVSLAEPLTPEVILDAVLPRLVRVDRGGEPGDAILVLDASRALPVDDRAWNLLFQRMNEQRNRISRAIGGSFVLCVPPRLERVFARAAPDFWSVRSFAVNLAIAPPPRARSEFLHEVLRSTPLSLLLSHSGIEYGEALSRVVDNTLALLDQRIVAAATLAIYRMRKGHIAEALRSCEDCHTLTEHLSDSDRRRHQCERANAWIQCLLGHSDEASYEINRCVAGVQKRAAHSRDRATRELLVECLVDAAQINLLIGRTADTERAALEATQISRELLEDEPLNAFLRVALSAGLDCLGDTAYQTFDVSWAIPWYSEARKQRRELTLRLRESAALMAEEHLRLGLVYWAMEGAGAGLGPCEKGVALLKALLGVRPYRKVSLALALHLGNLGDLHRERGDPARAALAYDEALAIARELHVADPDNLFARDVLAMSWIRWARHSEEEQRALEPALAAWRDAEALFASLIAEAPARRDWTRLHRECIDEIERLAAALTSTPS